MKTPHINSNEIIQRYKMARNFEQESFTKSFALNSRLYPKWIGESDTFIYERETKVGHEYRFVDAKAGTNASAFDHNFLADALEKKIGKTVSGDNLPISELDVSKFPDAIVFSTSGKRWQFELASGNCDELPLLPPHWLVSPDGKRAVFIRDHNLWMADCDGKVERQLTLDGELHYSYGVTPERTDLAGGAGSSLSFSAPFPQGQWSADSKRFFTFQTDERQVREIPVTVYAPRDSEDVRPQCVNRRYAIPGDLHFAEYRMVCIDTDTARLVEARYPRVVDAGDVGPFQRGRTWWNKDDRRVYFVDMARGEKVARVVEFDTVTGDSRTLFEESSSSYIDLHFMNEEVCAFLPLPDSNEFVWWSERSGCAHLYLYDATTGKLKRELTQGAWLVRDVLGFDRDSRDLFFHAAGRDDERDPYYREVCRVNLDTGELITLGSGDCDFVVHKSGLLLSVMKYSAHDTDHVAGVSPTGNYFVATRTRVDMVPVSELYDRNGRLLLMLETADTSALPDNWQWPEPVKLKAADGATDIFGVIFRPTHFDPNKHYPVIDYAAGHAVVSNVPKGSFCSDPFSSVIYLTAAAWAELGFIVVTIDGRGTTFRDKSFHHASYGRLHTASNLEDHICGLKQLAEQYCYMDLDNVGITGPGGCNIPVYGLLAYPDFYKVGTAISTYDVRLAGGMEIYQGPPEEFDYNETVLGSHAANLKGKLLLVHGMLDNFFHPAGMFQLVDELVRENKVFDMLVLPNGGHMWREGYPLNRAWDYMVTHLLKATPPSDFKLKTGKEYALDEFILLQS